jgi:hypothetical protein
VAKINCRTGSWCHVQVSGVGKASHDVRTYSRDLLTRSPHEPPHRSHHGNLPPTPLPHLPPLPHAAGGHLIPALWTSDSSHRSSRRPSLAHAMSAPQAPRLAPFGVSSNWTPLSLMRTVSLPWALPLLPVRSGPPILVAPQNIQMNLFFFLFLSFFHLISTGADNSSGYNTTAVPSPCSLAGQPRSPAATPHATSSCQPRHLHIDAIAHASHPVMLSAAVLINI